MPSKGPPPRPSAKPILSAPPPAEPAPQARLTAAATSEKAGNIFRKRRSGLLAVAIVIIAGAGSLIGAQMKSNQQAREKLVAQVQVSRKELDNENQTGIDQDLGKAVAVNKEDDTTEAKILQAQAVNDIPTTSGRGMSYNQRQIAFLEDRRGVLMKERFDLEKKIERVREKKKREEEMESRRGAGITSDR